MWYYNSQIIKTPKTMVISDITYPKAIFRNSDTLASLGIKPYSVVTPDNRYYHYGAYTVDTSGAEVLGTYAGSAIDVVLGNTTHPTIISAVNISIIFIAILVSSQTHKCWVYFICRICCPML